MNDVSETRIEIEICPECFGTGFANHYLSAPHNDRECWKCKGAGEVATDTNLVRDLVGSPGLADRKGEP